MIKPVSSLFLWRILILTAFLFGALTLVVTAKGYPPRIKGAEAYVYKIVDGVELKLWVYRAKGMSGEAAPALLFFFGGGWNGGSPVQFIGKSQYLADRGMHGIVADYRVKSRHGVRANECVKDARDALRYLKANAEAMGIDRNRIGVGGGSAGGHLAACLGTIHANESTAPNALVLYNPATLLAPINAADENFALGPEIAQMYDHRIESRQGEMRIRLGVSPEQLSPFHHVVAATPPTIIFHGTQDKTVPHFTAVLFSKKLESKGVFCENKTYKNAGHGFFNKEPYKSQTTEALDRFLRGLGWIK
jgi:acetyl esterase/lipase